MLDLAPSALIFYQATPRHARHETCKPHAVVAFRDNIISLLDETDEVLECS